MTPATVSKIKVLNFLRFTAFLSNQTRHGICHIPKTDKHSKREREREKHRKRPLQNQITDIKPQNRIKTLEHNNSISAKNTSRKKPKKKRYAAYIHASPFRNRERSLFGDGKSLKAIGKQRERDFGFDTNSALITNKRKEDSTQRFFLLLS